MRWCCNACVVGSLPSTTLHDAVAYVRQGQARLLLAGIRPRDVAPAAFFPRVHAVTVTVHESNGIGEISRIIDDVSVAVKGLWIGNTRAGQQWICGRESTLRSIDISPAQSSVLSRRQLHSR